MKPSDLFTVTSAAQELNEMAACGWDPITPKLLSNLFYRGCIPSKWGRVIGRTRVIRGKDLPAILTCVRTWWRFKVGSGR
jgi:hypothetical protein